MTRDTKLVTYSWKTSLLPQSLICVCVLCIPTVAGILDPFMLLHSLNTGALPSILEGI